jgi:hypothetical protein
MTLRSVFCRMSIVADLVQVTIKMERHEHEALKEDAAAYGLPLTLFPVFVWRDSIPALGGGLRPTRPRP